MNRIQMISREVEARRLKLQLGIDPALDIDLPTLRNLWHTRSKEQLLKRVSQESHDTRFNELPPDPAFLATD